MMTTPGLQLPLRTTEETPIDPTQHPAFPHLVHRYKKGRRYWRTDRVAREAALSAGMDQREFVEAYLAQAVPARIPSHLLRGLEQAHYEAAWEASGE